MTELEKFQTINQCETEGKLSLAILKISEDGMIQGRKLLFEARKMSIRVAEVIAGRMPVNVLTREFGIRQQAIYLMYYEIKET